MEGLESWRLEGSSSLPLQNEKPEGSPSLRLKSWEGGELESCRAGWKAGSLAAGRLEAGQLGKPEGWKAGRREAGRPLSRINGAHRYTQNTWHKEGWKLKLEGKQHWRTASWELEGGCRRKTNPSFSDLFKLGGPRSMLPDIV